MEGGRRPQLPNFVPVKVNLDKRVATVQPSQVTDVIALKRGINKIEDTRKKKKKMVTPREEHECFILWLDRVNCDPRRVVCILFDPYCYHPCAIPGGRSSFTCTHGH